MVFPRKKGNEPSGPVDRARELYELAVRNLEHATSLAQAGPPRTGTGAPLELTRWQLTEHHDSSNEDNMARLNPSVLSNGCLRGNEQKTIRLPIESPTTSRGSGAGIAQTATRVVR